MLRFVSVVLSILLSAIPAASAPDENVPTPKASTEIPRGLDDFLEARGLELNGEYSDALKLYAMVVDENPEVLETRVAEASLMMDLGMVEDALELLENREGLDWYGLRVRALAMAQVSGVRTELLPEAETELKRVLRDRGDDPNVQFALVRVLEASGKLEEALTNLRELRKAVGGNTRLAALEGELLSRLGRSAEALKAYGECENSDPSCHQGLVKSLLALGRMGEAGEQLLEGLAPDDLDRMMQAAALLADGHRPVKALSVVEQVLRSDADSPEALRFKAILLVRMGRMEEALPILDRLVRKDPENTELLLTRAQAQSTLDPDDMEKARRDLERAWNAVSSDAASKEAAGVAVEAARIELDAGHPTMAREWLDRVADPNSGGGNYLFLLAESYRKSGKYKAGVASLLRLEPQLDQQLRPLARILEADLGYRASGEAALEILRPLFDQGDRKTALMALSELQNLELWERMEAESRKLLKRFPQDRDLLFSLATALERRGHFEMAVELFDELLKAYPQDAGAANYLGYMLADADRDLDRALELITAALNSDPENGAYLDSMGWVLFRMGRVDEAEVWLQKALRRSGPQAGDILAHLGEVRISLGRTSEGVELLRRALDLGCEHPERVEKLISGTPGGDGDGE